MHNIINPCCTERELGQLLREAHGHAVMFQTQGDVTMTTLLKATMLMSGDRPRTLTIATPTLPQEAMRLVERYAQLGYISRLRLMLEEGQRDEGQRDEGQRGLVRGSDLNHVPVPSVPTVPDLISHFSSLIPHFDVAIATVVTPPSLLMWQGSTGTVVIQGHVPDVVTPALHLYAAILGGSQSVGVLNAIAPFEALFRARKVGHEGHGDRNVASELNHVPVPSVPAVPTVPSTDATVPDSSPKRTSRKKKSEI